MAEQSIKSWIAGLGLSALVGIYGYTQLFETPEPEKKQEASNGIHLKDGAASNPFAAARGEQRSEEPQEVSPVANAWTRTAGASEKDSDFDPERLQMARSFFRKLQAENNDFVRKFDYLDYAFNAIGRKLDNAHLLGLDKRGLAAMIRNVSLRAVQDLQYQPPADTAFGRLMQANTMRIAHEMSGIADDGTFDGLYAEQVTGMTYASINDRKIALALPAAKEAYALLRNLAPEQVAALSDDELHHRQTMTNLVDYVLNSAELSDVAFQRKENRYAAVGADEDNWYQRHLDLHDMLAAEIKARMDREQKAPTTPAPWGEPGR